MIFAYFSSSFVAGTFTIKGDFMSENKYKRKLTAILSADVVGYSRLMSDDEESTIQTLNAYRDLMATLIEDYSGSVVDAVGDNLLAEFTSAVDAVQCAITIQLKLRKQNEKLAESRRMLFRIGLNIGDVIQEKDRIYGDGVNIAARIESLADPGGVYISRNIYNHIKKKVDFEYEYIGEHTVKNISDPVRVYKVLMDSKDAGKLINEKSDPLVKKNLSKKWLRIVASVVLILSAVLAGVYWKYIYLPAPTDIDPDSKMEFNLSEGPSIAVLPFVNMSKDPELEYLCDSITENLISVLAQVPQVLVIARNSTFAYKDKSINVRQIGQELGARYVIEGSIQKSDDRYRFVVQLIDTDTGVHIWSGRYDREFKDIFKLQDEITLEILKAAGIKVVTQDQYPPGLLDGIGDINSVIIFSKLNEFLQNPTRVQYARALKNAKEIITKNPEYPYRYDCLASVYLVGVAFGLCEHITICLSKAADAIKRSFSIDANNWFAHDNLGMLFIMRKQLDKAILSFKKAIELNPNSASSYFGIGRVLNYSDKPEEALEYINKAIRLNPVPPYYYLYNLGYSYSLLDQHEKAIKMFKKCLKLQPNFWFAYASLAVSYSLSGQENNAKTAVRELLILFPDYSIEFVKKNSLYKNQDKLNRRMEALRKAGVPEKAK